MDRIGNENIKINKKNKKKNTKRKAIVIVILLAILVGIFFLINMLLPIKDVTDDNITINLSTTKLTGKNVIASLDTKSNYDIFYFIDYSAGEEKYYENEDFSEEVEEISEDLESSNTTSNNTISNTTNSTSKNTITNNTTKNTSSNTTGKSTKLDTKEVSDKEYKKVENSKFEIESNGIVYLKYGRFGKLSSTPYVFEVSNIDKTGPEIGEIETSSTYTSITVVVNAIDETSSNLQYYFRLANSNTYISAGSKNSYTFTDLTTDESYTIFVKVADKFGNESEAVTEATATVETEVIQKKIYHFKVNLGANTVTVYDKDDSGKYTKPIKAFICSTGKATPKSGTYKISDRYRWRSLFGGVYGQYAVRIHGNILFHSVPYEQMYANTLEYAEYDKLGTSASMGCIRLCVRDAKWIYDNAKTGSTVEFYSDSSNPGPLGKPKSQKISDNKENRNWDPTDPDKHNPWLGGDGKVNKVTVVNNNSNNNTNINSNITNNTTANSVSNTTTNTVSNTTNSTSNKNELIIDNDVTGE